jgi:hypothetical protein
LDATVQTDSITGQAEFNLSATDAAHFLPLSALKNLKSASTKKAVITNQQVTRGFSSGWMGSLPALPTRCCPSSRNRVVSWLLRAQNS